MSSLPEEIIEENILTRLPVKSISRFRCVSKSWRLLFQNPNFIKNHLKHANLINKFNILVTNDMANNSLFYIDNTVLSSTSSPFEGHVLEIDYPFMYRKCAVELIGSCDGLVCIGIGSYQSICIWNPATREYKRVPKTPIGYPSADSEANDDYLVAVGFGFDCKNDDYKVLRIVGFEGCMFSEARVYSLKSNSWKELGFIPCDFSFGKNEGVLLNGVLHWVRTARHDGLKTSVIVCYNISDETFLHMPLPNNSTVMSELGIWEQKLCLLSREDQVVWIMIDNKWNKHLRITAQITGMHYGRPVQTLQNGEILFETGSGPTEENSTGFISYDHKLERARAMKIHGFPEDFVVVTYIETLVALNSDTYVGQQQKEYQRSNTTKRRNGY